MLPQPFHERDLRRAAHMPPHPDISYPPGTFPLQRQQPAFSRRSRIPATNLRDPTVMWDFWSLSPESLHQVTILFSDRGTPDGYRHMHGFSSHTFSLINAAGERF